MEAEHTSHSLDIEEIGGDGQAVVRYEARVIKIPFNLKESKDKVFFEMFKKLKREIDDLKKREQLLASYLPREISDEEARKDMISYLKNKKLKGNQKTDILDITSNLSLPADQVERVLEILDKEGVVKING